MINWSRVNELRQEVGEEDFLEVVDLFLEEVEEVLDRLSDHFEPDRLNEDMHFLKGSALSLGFAAFSDLCQNAEKLSAAGMSDKADVPSIVETYVQSKICFLGELDQRLAA